MLQKFNNVNYIMNWEKFNDVKIIKIRLMRIKMCLIEILINLISWIMKRYRTLNSSQRLQNWMFIKFQIIII